jgi:hypothetical protein
MGHVSDKAEEKIRTSLTYLKSFSYNRVVYVVMGNNAVETVRPQVAM